MSLNRNLLIEAGAGTGKTTRLVKAVIQALFIREIPLGEMVALTFTNKAASELKARIADALKDILDAGSKSTLREKPWWPDPEPTLPLSNLQDLARKASTVMDRADISTIHSFAYALLKCFPLAAGIDPNSVIDDKGVRFDELFRRDWPMWLSVELGANAPREAQWLELLSRASLDDVEKAARELSDFKVPLDKLLLSDAEHAKRLKELHERIQALVADHPGEQKAHTIARACEEVIGAAAQGAWGKLEKLPEETTAELKRKLGDPTEAWNEENLEKLEMLQAVAKNLIARGDRVIGLLTQLLKPFAVQFRETLLSEGCLTHSALLFISREMVKHHPEIRATLKADVRLILIDEFQDTDPLQAELLLFIAEAAGRHAAEWDVVQFGEGKLFIVGDPKQSIYRFRGADIAAYERIGQLVLKQGGFPETLEINYRSQSQIIHLVNSAFEKIIRPIPDISPPYVSVRPHPEATPTRPIQDVEIWLAGSPEKQSTDNAQDTEAEHMARWIKASVGELMVHDPKEKGLRPLRYMDVALIFRSYHPMDRFIDALRRHGLPFAVESERYFFTTPEITDFINLLRAADNPDDVLSLVGFLRSPLAGLTDEEILKRRHADTLEEAEAVRWIRGLTKRLGRETLAEVLHSIFEETFLMELAVRSYHGDQTVANLLKLRRLLEGFAAEGVMTMGLLLEKLEEFFADDTIEGENPLADESYNAVRLLTVHKAKGLEYPVVFLPSLHSQIREHPSKPFSFSFDWRTQRLGLKLPDNSNTPVMNLEKIELDAMTRAREAEEEKRVLYVAMTRARERLVLSGGINLKTNSKNTYLKWLTGAWDCPLEELTDGKRPIGESSLTVRHLTRMTIAHKASQPVLDDPQKRVDLAAFAKIWNERQIRYEQIISTPLLLTPSKLDSKAWDTEENDDPDTERREPATPRTQAKMLGTLVHRFLEKWDFRCEKCSIPAQLRHVANVYFAGLGLLKQPFPDPKEGEKTDNPSELVAIVDDAQKILADFIGSEAFNEIKGSKILGREIPFFYEFNRPVGADPRVRPQSGSDSASMNSNFGQAQGPAPTLMRGTIDILYRLPSGQVVIGDYKTSRSELGARNSVLGADPYSAQSSAYREAVHRALGVEATFKIIALREDE